MEPPEIRQMRLQIHQYTELIAAATRDQKRLQARDREVPGQRIV